LGSTTAPATPAALISVSCPLDRSRVIYGNSSIKEAFSQKGLAEQEISEKEDCSKERGGQENCHAIQA
jgi:hypothetical protein